MNNKTSLIVLVTMAGALAAGAAQARGSDELQWTVTIGSPGVTPVYRGTPDAATIYYQPAPPVRVHPLPPQRHAYQQPTRWDVDGDGIPNRYDRVYNPRWDVDGDGIPNHRDRAYNPRWDRDGDGLPNRRDPRPDLPQRGGWGR